METRKLVGMVAAALAATTAMADVSVAKIFSDNMVLQRGKPIPVRGMADPAGGNGYAKIRNAMRIAAQTIPNTGLAVAIDIGNDKDIHPKNKYDVGYRLSLWALRDVYGMKDLVVSGPMFKEMKVEGSKARLVFDHVGSGLMAGEKGPDTPGVKPTPTPDGRLRGFAVAGADKKWHWAEAVIEGNNVVVSVKEVPAPVAVRYAHRANPMGDCNLYNKEGLPASPFRTDNW